MIAFVLSDKEAVSQLLPKDTMVDLAIRILPVGILGARIYYVLFSWDSFADNVLSVFYIWEGGLAIYGGLIAGFLTVLFFCRRRKLHLFMMLDLIVPGVALAQSIGRWGNYFNQEAFGFPLNATSSLCFFPIAVLIQEPSGYVWHLATFFFESMLDLLISIFLFWGRRNLFRRRGDVFLFYVFLYSSGRLVIENMRMDSLYLGSTIRISQLFSIAAVIFILFYLFRRRFQTGCHLSPFLYISVTGCMIYSGLILFYCFTGSFIWNTTILEQILILSFYSVWIILNVFFLYGKSRISEVYYAKHKC